ncbi:MAG TPA: RNA methyltransferase [Bellilinea sp.]|nr:RNA methyltransferase [Bellilinea sp.]
MITSTQNPRIKHIRALLTNRKDRQQEKLFVIEGVRLAEEAARANFVPEEVLFSSDLSPRGRELVDIFGSAGSAIEEVDGRILHSLSDTDTSQGILALVPQPAATLPADWDLLLVLDQIRDPGNLGTILRSAAASGAQGVVLTPGSVDVYSPKVVRAGMGAHFHLPLLTLDWPEILDVCKQKHTMPAALLIADSSGGSPCWQTDLRQPVALVIGSEADGPQPAALAAADGLLHIPMPGAAESLNAAMAASILLYEVVRQRNM